MLHIYRQITSLKRVEPFVIAQKREEADRYPFERIAIVGKPATQQMLDAVRLVLVRSASLGRALINLGCPAGKIRLHHTGIPVDEIPFRLRAWPANAAWKFVQACRLIEKKGLRVSLRAFAKF